ncbi:hypothetical protein [Alteromonas sp. a30]|uniref:hypothetical protein n=1 Tax=Alteromonas sp. a30 TaxID=2730917 RepID=UPI00228083F3|nr:hypothetical protein [Alteromonas sp. a30]MCY7294210.1 hypothetical protein [Alteromonas sp. a30]
MSGNYLSFELEEDIDKKTISYNAIEYDEEGNETQRKTYLTYDFANDTLTFQAKNIQFATEAMDVDKPK